MGYANKYANFIISIVFVCFCVCVDKNINFFDCMNIDKKVKGIASLNVFLLLYFLKKKEKEVSLFFLAKILDDYEAFYIPILYIHLFMRRCLSFHCFY